MFLPVYVKSKDTVKEVRKFDLDWLKGSDLKQCLFKKLDADRKYYPKCLASDPTYINKKSTLLANSKTDKYEAALKDLEKNNNYSKMQCQHSLLIHTNIM